MSEQQLTEQAIHWIQRDRRLAEKPSLSAVREERCHALAATIAAEPDRLEALRAVGRAVANAEGGTDIALVCMPTLAGALAVSVGTREMSRLVWSFVAGVLEADPEDRRGCAASAVADVMAHAAEVGAHDVAQEATELIPLTDGVFWNAADTTPRSVARSSNPAGAPKKKLPPDCWWDEEALNEHLRQRRQILDAQGHYYFIDCDRENWARLINWGFRNERAADLWFWTGTFRSERVSAEGAWRKLAEYMEGREEDLNEKNGGKARLRYAAVCEEQGRGTIHFHAIVYARGLGSETYSEWKKAWRQLAGRSHIGPHRPKAAPYLAKFVHRGAEVYFGGDWSGRSAPKRLQCKCCPKHRTWAAE